MMDDKTFVEIWQGSGSRAMAAEMLGITPEQAGRIADRLRRAGVELKRFPRGRPKKEVLVDDLNEVIRQLKES